MVLRCLLEVLPRSEGAPGPDGSWLKVTKDRWGEFWGSDLASYVKADSDLPGLRRLFGLYDERERMAREYRKARMTTGSKGQPVVNPAAHEIASLDGRIVQLETRFGLSPIARLKLGITFGEAVASLAEVNARMAGDSNVEAVDPRGG